MLKGCSMEHAAIQGGERDALEASHALWLLLTAIAAAEQESERVRLVATGIPSLLECSLSGLALRREADGRWDPVLHKEGQPVSFATGATAQEWSMLFEAAIHRGLLLLPSSAKGSHA